MYPNGTYFIMSTAGSWEEFFFYDLLNFPFLGHPIAPPNEELTSFTKIWISSSSGSSVVTLVACSQAVLQENIKCEKFNDDEWCMTHIVGETKGDRHQSSLGLWPGELKWLNTWRYAINLIFFY